MGFFKDEFSMSEMDEERFGHCINHGVYYGDYNEHCPMCKIAELAGFIKKLKHLVKCSIFPCDESYGRDCKGFDFDCKNYEIKKDKNVVEIFIEKEKTHINYDSNYYKNKKEAIESAIDVLKLILIKGK